MISNYEMYKKERHRDRLRVYKSDAYLNRSKDLKEEKKEPQEMQYQSRLIQQPHYYSNLLPRAVLNTLNHKDQILEVFDKRCSVNKEKVSQDIDNNLKEVILVFEQFKEKLFNKIDDHRIGFHNLVNQLDRLSTECSQWGEQKMQEIDKIHLNNNPNDETLYSQINEARVKRQKADDVEKALLAIKQKIEQMRLNELNNDVTFLLDDKNPEIYLSSENADLGDKIKTELNHSLERVDINKLVRPFLLDKKIVRKADPRATVITHKEYKSNPTQMKETPKLPQSNVINTDLNQNKKIGGQKGNFFKNPPIIAQQNHFLSDQIDLSNPVINLETEIIIKNTSKVTSIICLTNKIVLLGNENGNFIILDIVSQTQMRNQLLIKAHDSPVRILNKTNDILLLTSANEPDYSLKLWDLSSLIDFEKNNQKSEEVSRDNSQIKNNIILLISILKAHKSLIIGHGFLTGRIVISVDRSGIVHIWDWKLNTPISSLNLNLRGVKSFLLFSNKEGFVVSNQSGKILAYKLVKSQQGYDFVKQTEIQENQPINRLQSFRGNNDLIIVTLDSGDVKLISKKSNLNLNTIIGCKSPLSFFILTCVKPNPDVYLLAAEPYGFKIADVDHPEFKYVNTNSQKNFRFECYGTPNWQILDSIPNQKMFFVTVNHATKPNTIMLWSLAPNKPL